MKRLASGPRQGLGRILRFRQQAVKALGQHRAPTHRQIRLRGHHTGDITAFHGQQLLADSGKCLIARYRGLTRTEKHQADTVSPQLGRQALGFYVVPAPLRSHQANAARIVAAIAMGQKMHIVIGCATGIGCIQRRFQGFKRGVRQDGQALCVDRLQGVNMRLRIECCAGKSRTGPRQQHAGRGRDEKRLGRSLQEGALNAAAGAGKEKAAIRMQQFEGQGRNRFGGAFKLHRHEQRAPGGGALDAGPDRPQLRIDDQGLKQIPPKRFELVFGDIILSIAFEKGIPWLLGRRAKTAGRIMPVGAAAHISLQVEQLHHERVAALHHRGLNPQKNRIGFLGLELFSHG